MYFISHKCSKQHAKIQNEKCKRYKLTYQRINYRYRNIVEYGTETEYELTTNFNGMQVTRAT